MSSDCKVDADYCDNSVNKLPRYGVSNPRIWFRQLEAYFELRNMRAQRKMFLFVITQLPTEIACEVSDLIDDIPTETPYAKLKAALLKRTSASDEARLQQLLSGVQLGDRTPSQLLRHMNSLKGDSQVADAFLRQLWSKCLPTNTVAILSIQENDVPLNKLAEIADKIHECYGRTPVSQISVEPTPMEIIEKRLDQLTLAISNVTTNRPTNNYRPRSRSRSSSSKPYPHKDTMCYYHRRFGDQAKRCTYPCSHPKAALLPKSNQGNAQASQ